MESDDVKDLTETIGPCGRFQFFLIVAVHSATMSVAFSLLAMVFGMYNPGLTCLDTDMIDLNHFSSPASPRSTALDEHLNETSWELNCTVMKACKKWAFKTEGGSTLVTEWNLVCDLAWVPSTIITIEMVGVLVGSCVTGQLSDLFGRKKGLYVCVALNGVSHLLASFSVSWQMAAVVYFFLGMAANGITSCAYSYPLEFVNGWWRGVLAGIPIWPISFVVYAVTVYVLKDWRLIHIAAAVLCLIVLLIGFWTPESVRWLAVTGKVNQSKKVVARIARINRQPCPDTSAIDEIALEEKRKMQGHKYTYLDLFRISSLRPLIIKFALIWISLQYIYFVLNFSLASFAGDFYINLIISALLEFPGIIFLAPLLNKLGRRYTALLIVVIEVICCFSLVLLNFVMFGDDKEMTFFALALFCKTLNISSWGICNIYSPELFPTVVRNIHYGFLCSVSRIGGILSPFLVPNSRSNFYICFIVIGMLGLLRFGIFFSLPESMGRELKDTIFVNNLENPAVEGEDERPI